MALIAGGSTASAQAADFPVVVACAGWQAEFAAQVEARIRTTLLAEGLEAREVGIACAPDDSVSVRVVSSSGELTRPVVRRGARIEDDVVRAVEAALTELLPTPGPGAPASPPPAATPPAAAPSASPVPPAPLQPPAVVPLVDIPPALATRPARVTELCLSPRGKLWDGVGLLGAEAGLSVGSELLQYGLALGGGVALGEPPTFVLYELTASARLALTSAKVAGLRGQLGVGFSLLAATPAANVSADGSTTLGAAFLELHVSRPFFFDSFGIAPGLGARAFIESRVINVDDQEELLLPRLAPEAALSFIYRP